ERASPTGDRPLLTMLGVRISRMRRKFKHIAFITLLLSPFAAWAFVKPVRVFAPELAGVTCLSAHICIDEASRFVEATRLYDEGVSFVQSQVGTMQAHLARSSAPPRNAHARLASRNQWRTTWELLA